MIATPIIEEIRHYIITDEFRQGIYVEIGGMLIDIALLAILVPLVIWLVNLPRKRRARSMASFYTLQFIRTNVDLLLKIGGAREFDKLIQKELSLGKIRSLVMDPIYGNTNNLFELLRLRMQDGSHVEGHKSLTESDILMLRGVASDLITKLDQYVFLFNSVGLPEYSEKFFNTRMILFPLRDYLEFYSDNEDTTYFNADPVRGVSTVSASFFYKWFVSEKVRPDRAKKSKFYQSAVLMIMKIPFLLVYRILVPKLKKIVSKPYIDPSASDFFPLMLRTITEQFKVSRSDLAVKLGISEKLMESYSLGYSRPPPEVARLILLEIRQSVEEKLWITTVVTHLFSDIARRKPGLAEFDSVKAEAMMWFVTLVGGATDSNPESARFFWKLFSLRHDDIDLSYPALVQDAAFVTQIRDRLRSNKPIEATER